MASVNKVILLGFVGRDPETRYAASGTEICNFSIATNEKRGEEEKTEWHKIVAFGKIADICGQYLHKGKQVYLEGKLQTRCWEDKEGKKNYSTEIVAHNIVLLGDSRRQSERPKPNVVDDDDRDLPF